MSNLVVEHWGIEEFKKSRTEWNELLNKSDADPLFMSWEWIYHWWDIFSEPSDELLLLVIRNKNQKLKGIAPLFLSNIKHKKVISTKRLQFIGNHWREKETMPVEIIDFIVHPSDQININRTFLQYISKSDNWDEFIIPYLSKSTKLYKLLLNNDILGNCYKRKALEYKSYFITTTSSFENYLKSLGKNTRLKLFNRRKKLNNLGEIEISSVDSEIEKHFDTLNCFHQKRWGKPVSEGKMLDFNKMVGKLLAQNKQLNLSLIYLNNQVEAIQHNYRVNGHEYNIQSGFTEDIHKKISLGMLHFGYAIENAFQKETIVYHFLAGEEKNTQYKERLTKEHIPMIDMQIIRSPFNKLLFKTYDKIKYHNC